MQSTQDYEIVLFEDEAYAEHLGGAEFNYTTDPQTLTEADIERIGEPEYMYTEDGEEGMAVNAKLRRLVKVRFPDGFEIEFPINSAVVFTQVPGESKVILRTLPGNPYAAGQLGGRVRKSRKSRNRRRKSRRRHTRKN